MDAIEQTEASKPAPKKKAKRKPARRAAAPRVPAAAKPAADQTGEFGGMTSTECCFDCSAERCIIGGKPVCGHPNKGGGTQPAIQRDPAAVAIFQRARKQLAVTAVQNRS